MTRNGRVAPRSSRTFERPAGVSGFADVRLTRVRGVGLVLVRLRPMWGATFYSFDGFAKSQGANLVTALVGCEYLTVRERSPIDNAYLTVRRWPNPFYGLDVAEAMALRPFSKPEDGEEAA